MSTSPRVRRRDRKVDGDSGFTLIETLVSVSLLALVGGAATTGLVTGLRTQAANETRTVAANLVRADLDQARAVQYPSYPGSTTARPLVVGGRTFTLVRAVSATGGGAGTGCPATITSTGVLSLTVTSTVTWTDHGSQSLTMATEISC